MSKIKVLIFANSFRVGGSERQAVELLKRLDRTRFTPLVACFQRDGPLLNELPADVSVVETFPMSGFCNFNAAKQGIKFIRLLKRMRVEVVQCFDFYSNVFAVPLSRVSRVPVILASRRDEGLSMRNRVQHRTELACFRFANGIVTNSEGTRVQLKNRDHVLKTPIWTIHNGIDLVRFDREKIQDNALTATKAQRLTIALIANLRPEKGHLMMLDVFQSLVKHIPAVELLFVGEGPMREAIASRIKELGLVDCVHMTGMIKNIPALLQTVDIVVSASISEAFPNALLEAMAGSIPVVATDVGGTRELVVDGVTGYLVPPRRPFDLAQKVEKLCRNPEERHRLGDAARRRISEMYTAERMATAFETLYQRLLASH